MVARKASKAAQQDASNVNNKKLIFVANLDTIVTKEAAKRGVKLNTNQTSSVKRSAREALGRRRRIRDRE